MALFLALLAGLAQPASAQTGAPVYNPANGHWYELVRVPSSIFWGDALNAAQSRSYAGYPGHLVTVTSAAEEQFVVSSVLGAVSDNEWWWMGGYQDTTAPDYREPGGGWRWVTGEPWSYTDWGSGQPDNGSGIEHSLGFFQGKQWNDFTTSNPGIHGFIVEYEPTLFPGSISIAQLLLVPNPVVGGQNSTGQVVLSQLAGPGGAVVNLSSSNPAAAVVPGTVVVPQGTSGMTFPIVTFPVGDAVPVVLSAAYLGSTIRATLQVVPPLSPPGNLLINGSFEDPPNSPYGTRNLPGWRVTRGTVDLTSEPDWQASPGGGKQSLDLVGTPGAATIEQSFPTEPGREYVFSGWISHNVEIAEGRANVFLNGQFFIQLYHREPLSTSHDMHWIRFSYRFRATAPTTTLTLEDVTNLWDAGGGLFLDGLAVTPAEAPGPPPPPSTRQVPAAPTNLVAERVASTQIDLRWQDNSDNEQEFILWRRSGGGDYVRIGKVGANVTRFSDTGLQPSTTYSYLVRAWNPAGASRHSNELTVQTPAPPGSPAPNALVPPTALTATALSATAIRLTWQDNSSDEAAFVLYRQDPGGDSVKIATVPANSTSYVDQGLRPGTLYRYLVRAWNPQSGASRRSNEASATTPLAQ